MDQATQLVIKTRNILSLLYAGNDTKTEDCTFVTNSTINGIK